MNNECQVQLTKGAVEKDPEEADKIVRFMIRDYWTHHKPGATYTINPPIICDAYYTWNSVLE